MVSNCQFLAHSAPREARVSMNIQFGEPLPIQEFLQKVNFRNFHSVNYWSGLRFYFTFVGMARMGFFYDREVYIPHYCTFLNSHELEKTLLEEIKKFCLYDFDSEPKISKMRIGFDY